MKRLALSILIIVTGIGLFSYSACGITYYDIAGTWTFTLTSGETTTTIVLTFDGTRKEGIVGWNEYFMGNYTYGDSTLNFSLTYGSNLDLGKVGTEVYTGSFEDYDFMNGKFSGQYQNGQASGTWTAVRQ